MYGIYLRIIKRNICIGEIEELFVWLQFDRIVNMIKMKLKINDLLVFIINQYLF